jgi:hypothetical protein
VPVEVSRGGVRLATGYARDGEIIKFCDLAPGRVDLTVQREGCGLLQYRFVLLQADRERAVHLSFDDCEHGEAPPPPPTPICDRRLRVVDASGKPLGATTVHSAGVSGDVQTGDTGDVLLTLWSGRSYVAEIQHPGFVTKRVVVTCKAPVAEDAVAVVLESSRESPEK